MFERLEGNSGFGDNVFSLLSDRWMLITAGTARRLNTMTASWGGLGVLWGKNVATIYVRPQRYTRRFIEEHDYFTLSFFGEEYRDKLTLCGTKSGREVDKVAQCGFTVESAAGGAPYFAEAELVAVCRKLYRTAFDPANFLSPALEKHYPDRDYHQIYIGEIVEVLKRRYAD